MQLETLLLDFMADTSRLYQEIDKAVAYAERAGRRMESAFSATSLKMPKLEVLKPRVDMRELHELNKLYDRKQSHHRETQRVVSQPIKPRVDTSDLKKAASAYQELINAQSGVKSNTRIVLEYEVRTKYQAIERQNGRTEIRVRGLDELPDRIAKAVEKAVKPSLLEKAGHVVGSAVSGVGRIAAGVVTAPLHLGASILGGVGLGLAQNATVMAGKGIESAINTYLSSRFGSIDLLMEKAVGKYGSQAFKAISGIDANAVEESVLKFIDSSGASDKAKRQLKQIYRGIREEVRATVEFVVAESETLVDQNEATLTRLANKRRSGIKAEKNKDLAREQSQADVRQSAREYFDANNFADTVLPNLKQKAVELDSKIKQKTKELSAFVADYKKTTSPDFIGVSQQNSVITKEITMLTSRLEKLQSEYKNTINLINNNPAQKEKSTKQYFESVEVRDSFSPQRLPKEIELIIKKLYGNKMPTEKDLPKFQVQDQIIAQESVKAGLQIKAFYHNDANLIGITSELQEAFTNIEKLTADHVQSIAEEVAHAIQTGFGSFEGSVAAKKGEPLYRTNVTREDWDALSSTLEAYSAGGFDDKLELELDAKTRVRQVFDGLLEDLLPEDLTKGVEVLDEYYKRLVSKTNELWNTLRQIKKMGGDPDGVEQASIWLHDIERLIKQSKQATKVEVSGVSGPAFGLEKLPEKTNEVLKFAETLTSLQNRITTLKPVTDIVPATEPIEKAGSSMGEYVQSFGSALVHTSEHFIEPAGKIILEGARRFAKAAVDATLYTATHPMHVVKRGIQDTAMAGLAFGLASQAPILGPVAGGISHLVGGAASPFIASHLGGSAAQLTASIMANPFVHLLGKIPFVGGDLTGMIAGGLTGMAGGATSALSGALGGLAGGAAIMGGATLPMRGVSKALSGNLPQLPSAQSFQLPFSPKQPERLALAGTPEPESLRNAATAQTQAAEAVVAAKSKAMTAIAKASKDIQVLADQASDVWENIDKQSLASEAVQKAKSIQGNFQLAYQRFKKAVDEGNVDLAKALGETILETASNAKEEIHQIIADLATKGVDTSSGSSVRNALGGVLQTFTKSSKGVEKGYTKLERDRKTGQVTLDVTGTTLPSLGLGTASSFLGQKGFTSVSQQLAELNERIEKEGVMHTAMNSPVARDLAVNTVGFLASQAAAPHGTIATLGGDLTGALIARKALTDMIALYKAYRQSIKESGDATEESSTKIERFKDILARTAKILQSPEMQKELGGELFGDITGFGVGNITAMGLGAAGMHVPLQGAAGAMLAVPQLQKIREAITNTFQSEIDNEISSLSEVTGDILPSLNINKTAGKLGEGLKNLLAELGELIDVSLGLSGETKKTIESMKRTNFSLGIPLPTPDSEKPKDGVYWNSSRRLEMGGIPLVGASSTTDGLVKDINSRARQTEKNADNADRALREIEEKTKQQIEDSRRIIQEQEQSRLVSNEKLIEKARASRLAASEAMSLVDDQIFAMDVGLPRSAISGGGGGGGFLDNLKEKFNQLKQDFPILQKAQNLIGEIGSALFIGGAGFFIGTALVQFARSSFTAALEADRLKNALDFATVEGSTKVLSQIREETDRLGTSFDAAAKARQSLEAATIGSSLQPQVKGILTGFQERFAAQQLAPEAQGRVLQQVSQMIGKSRIQAEDIQTASESLPGVLQAVSRAMGTTTEETMKMGAAGNLLAEDVLPKLANQLSLESSDSAIAAANSASAEITRLGNNFLFVQQAAGGLTLSAVSGALKIINPMVSALSQNIDTLSAILAAAAISGSIQLLSLINKTDLLGKSLNITGKGIWAATKSLAGLTTAITRQIVLIGGLIALWETGKIALYGFDNASREYSKKATEDLQRLIEKQKEFNILRGKEKSAPQSQSSQEKGFKSSNVVTKVGDAIQRYGILGSILVTVNPSLKKDFPKPEQGYFSSREQQEIVDRNETTLSANNSFLQKVRPLIGTEFEKYKRQIQSLDQDLAAKRVERSMASLAGEPQFKLDAIDKQINELTQRRLKLGNQVYGQSQNSLEEKVKELKSIIESLEQNNASPNQLAEFKKQLQEAELTLQRYDQQVSDINETVQALAPELIKVSAAFEANKIDFDNRNVEERTRQLQQQRDLLMSNAEINNQSLRTETKVAEMNLQRLTIAKASYEDILDKLKQTDRVALKQALGGVDVSKASRSQLNTAKELAQAGLIKGITKDSEDAIDARLKILDLTSEQIQASNALAQAQLNERKGVDTLSVTLNRLASAYEAIDVAMNRSKASFSARLSQQKAALTVGDIGAQEQTAKRDIQDNKNLIEQLTQSRKEYIQAVANFTGKDRTDLEQAIDKKLNEFDTPDINRANKEFSLTENQKKALEAQQQIIAINDRVTQAQQASADAQLTLTSLSRSTYRSALGLKRNLDDFRKSIEDFYLGLQKQIRDSITQYKKTLLEIKGIETQSGLAELQSGGTADLLAPFLGFIQNLQSQSDQLEQQKLDLVNKPLDIAAQQRELASQTRGLNKQFADLSLELQLFKESLRGASSGLIGNQVTKFNRGEKLDPSKFNVVDPTKLGKGGSNTDLPNVFGGNTRINAMADAAQKLGVTLEDIATIIQIESSFANKSGGSGNRYKGYLQMGAPAMQDLQSRGLAGKGLDARKYSFEEQLKLFTDYALMRGYQPGMGVRSLYNTHNLGNPNATGVDGFGTPGGRTSKLDPNSAERQAAKQVLQALSQAAVTMPTTIQLPPPPGANGTGGGIATANPNEIRGLFGRSDNVIILPNASPSMLQSLNIFGGIKTGSAPVVSSQQVSPPPVANPVGALPVPALPPMPGALSGALPVPPVLPEQIQLQSQSVELSGQSSGLAKQLIDLSYQQLEADKQRLQAQERLNQAQGKQQLSDILRKSARDMEDLTDETIRYSQQVQQLNAQYALPGFATELDQQISSVQNSYADLTKTLTRRAEDLQLNLDAAAKLANVSTSEFIRLTGTPAEYAQEAQAAMLASMPKIEDAIKRIKAQIKSLTPQEAQDYVTQSFTQQALGDVNRARLGISQDANQTKIAKLNRLGDTFGAAKLQMESTLAQNEADFASNIVSLTESLAKIPSLSEEARKGLESVRISALDMNLSPDELLAGLAQIPMLTDGDALAVQTISESLDGFQAKQLEVKDATQDFWNTLSGGAQDAASSAFEGLFNNLDDLFSGVKSGTDVVREFFLTFLQGIQQVASSLLTNLIMKSITKAIVPFSNGGTVESFAYGGRVKNFAEGGSATTLGLMMIDAMQRERAAGGNPVPIVASTNEEILSAKSGDAQFYRSLQASGDWNRLKAGGNYADGSMPGYSGRGSSGAYGRIVIQNTYNLKDATGIRETEQQRKAREALEARRALSRL